MPSTFFGLTIGKSGLYASQAGINTTAHNISNTETDGYCRQLVEQSASTPLKVNATYGMAGTGTDVTGVVQVRDEYYDLKYWKNSTLAGNYTTKGYYMTQVENYFNEVKIEGFTTTFDKFHDSLQELSKNPADLTIRTQVASFGQSYCEYFNFISESMQKIQNECNFEIKNQAERINSIAKQIASLSKQINKLEVGSGRKANDLRDARNLLADNLSQIVNISVSEYAVEAGIGVNNYVVKVDGEVLVDGYNAKSLVIIPREEKINQTDVEGLYDLRWDNGVKFNIKSPSLKGTMQALFDVRDGNNGEAFKGKATAYPGDDVIRITSTNYNSVEKLMLNETSMIRIGSQEFAYTGFQVTQDEETGEYIYDFSIDTEKREILVEIDEEDAIIGRDIPYKGIPYYMSQMNEFVRTYAKAFNDAHKNGRDLEGNAGGEFFNGKDKITGENYVFEISPDNLDNGVLFTSKTGAYKLEEEENYGSYYFVTAGNFCVTTNLYYNPKKIAAASEIVNGIENADAVEALIALKSDRSMFRQGTPSAYLQTLVAEIGIDTDKGKQFAQNQEDILMSITNQRLSVSGVDSDEEAMNLIRYQNAYNLSAKVVSVMNEIYDKLINYTGV